jgi:hypothetical protein
MYMIVTYIFKWVSHFKKKEFGFHDKPTPIYTSDLFCGICDL